MPRYEFKDGTSNKFWEIVLGTDSFTTTYGRIGTAGQSSVKTFPNALKTQAAYDALIAEKVKKGYQPAEGGSAPGAPAPLPPASAKKAPSGSGPVGASTSSARTGDRATPTADSAAPTADRAAPTADRAAQTEASASETPSPSLNWTEQAQKEAKKELVPPDVDPRQPGNAASSWATLHEHFVKRVKMGLEHGLAATQSFRKQQQDVLWTWGNAKLPSTLDVQTQAASLLLLPTFHGEWSVQTELSVTAFLIDLWVAHAGLPFAIEAFTAAAALPSLDHHGVPKQTTLADGPPRELSALFPGRIDRCLRAYLRGAPPDALAAAKGRALELRAQGDLLSRTVLSALFLEPDWIDADLSERLRTQARALFTPEMLRAARSTEELAAYFANLTDEELDLLGPRNRYEKHEPTAAWTLMDTRREAAVVPLSRWLERAGRAIGEAKRELQRNRALLTAHELLSILTFTTNHPAVAEAICAIYAACGDQKIAKAEDPRLLAHEWLLRSPQVALPAVAAAAKKPGGAWAKALLPNLERLATRNQVQREVATLAELPELLRKPAKFKAPGFWLPEAFSPPLTRSGKALPPEALQALAAALQSPAGDTLLLLREALSPEAMASFTWDLFQAWLAAGAAAKDKWAFLALGVFGNDDTARRLTPLIRAWPGEAAHQRAVMGLDMLALIGSDVAMMMLNGIAQKLKFKGLQERARLKMEEIAARRGLTPEELADRLIPDLDLEDDGSTVLDFGPRSFRVGFDENLSPFVMDASGTRLKDLPKPNSKDDATLASDAVEAWKAMKKDARAVASIQLLRMELAMGAERRWSPEELHGFLISHPLMVHVVRRLVWGVFDDAGALTATFRVAEDRTLASIEDETFTLEPSAKVGIVHPLHLDPATLKKWSAVFSDYVILQPFEQLARQVFRLEAAEQKAKLLERFQNRKVETKKVMGLLSRGWFRGPAYDGGCIPFFIKRVGRELTAAVQLDPGFYAGAMDDTDPVQELGAVDFGTDEPDWGGGRPNAWPLSRVPAVVVSEVLRDLASLGEAKDEDA